MLTSFPQTYSNLSNHSQIPPRDASAFQQTIATPATTYANPPLPSPQFTPPLDPEGRKETEELERRGFSRPLFIGQSGERFLGNIDNRFINRNGTPEQKALKESLSQKNKELAESFNRRVFTISPNLKLFSGSYKKVDLPKTTQTQTQALSQPRFVDSNAQSLKPSERFQNLLKSLGSITTKFGGSTRYENFHPAVDVANKMGTPIPSFVGGVITDVVTGKKQGDRGYGNYVIVTDSQGNKHRYSHLHQAYVAVGQKVLPGQKIGTMGNTGSTYSTSGGDGTHLDYRIMDANNKYVNPGQFFAYF